MAVIANSSMAKQQEVMGTLQDIATKVRRTHC